ncbi:MAG: hypothetical protein HYY40_00120 [Bacteroidetes bacterium]|nr:hypothetical protein [Bacteroidota bacterium]
MANIVKKPGEIDRKLNKPAIINLAAENAHAIIDSKKFDLLKVYIELKRYVIYLNTLMENLKQHAFDQAAQNGKKTFEYSGAKVNLTSRTVWDFSSDHEWKELDDKIKELTQKKKEREKYLMEQPGAITAIDRMTGEIIEKTDLPVEINRGIAIRL